MRGEGWMKILEQDASPSHTPNSSRTIQTLQCGFGDKNQLVQKEDLVNIPWEQGIC